MIDAIALTGNLIIPKIKVADLAPKLGHHEFRCQCIRSECHFTIVNIRLLDAWSRVRLSVSRALKVNSGFRCQSHNIDELVAGSTTSFHTLGKAIDISTMVFSDYDRDLFEAICKIHFDVVIDYDTFLHCHMR